MAAIDFSLLALKKNDWIKFVQAQLSPPIGE